MNRHTLVPLLFLLGLSACTVLPRRGGGLEVVPILPALVEIDADGYYGHGGYHYYYTSDRWYYSDRRDGRRMELPRSHWPRETHRRGGNRRP